MNDASRLRGLWALAVRDDTPENERRSAAVKAIATLARMGFIVEAFIRGDASMREPTLSNDYAVRELLRVLNEERDQARRFRATMQAELNDTRERLRVALEERDVARAGWPTPVVPTSTAAPPSKWWNSDDLREIQMEHPMFKGKFRF